MAKSEDLQKLKDPVTKAARYVIAQMFSASGRDPSVWRFRASSLPMCQVDYALSKMTEKLDRAMNSPWTFRADFYTHIGTGLHSAIQKWLGRIKVLFGNWHCGSCHITLYNLLGTQYCIECGKEMGYEEYEMLDPENDFSGHCDGVLLLPGQKKPFLFELKSMGSMRGDKLHSTGELPIWYHILQTSAYVHLLRRDHNLDIGGVVFVYVPRNIDDLFDKVKVYTHQKIGMASRIYLASVKEYRDARSALRERRYNDLVPYCADNTTAPDCPWNNLFCFSDNKKKHMNELISEYESALEEK